MGRPAKSPSEFRREALTLVESSGRPIARRSRDLCLLRRARGGTGSKPTENSPSVTPTPTRCRSWRAKCADAFRRISFVRFSSRFPARAASSSRRPHDSTPACLISGHR